jgi:RimJ/RimL family protein N-acetyltransferase
LSDSAHNQRLVFEIDTERLKMRSLSESDESLYCELYGDAQTMRFIGPPLPLDRAARSFRKTLDSTRRHPVEQLILTVVDKATQQAIGICSIQQFDVCRRRAEAGIMLKPGSHAQGFAKECFKALITQAFAIFPLDEIWAQTAADNCVAERMFIRVGFSRSDEPESRRERLGQRIWSAYRESWHLKATTN